MRFSMHRSSVLLKMRDRGSNLAGPGSLLNGCSHFGSLN